MSFQTTFACIAEIVENVVPEHDDGTAVTFNAESDKNMITGFLWHELDDFALDSIWF